MDFSPRDRIHLKRDPAPSNVGLQLFWKLGSTPGRPEEAVLLEVLEGIDREGAVGPAARFAGISYRSAWGLIRRWETALGQSLVVMRRGHGSSLAPLGEALLRLDREVRTDLAPTLHSAGRRLARLVGPGAAGAARLSIRASHDFALSVLADLLRDAGHPVDLEFRGSVEALGTFAAGRCDVAGFHCARGEAAGAMWSRYRPLLEERNHTLVHVARRTQGIMVAPDNPKRLRALRDLARRDVRFINRQADAGTRLLLDALLEAQGVSPATIPGYGAIEFTHAAVAAMIASGQADAGLGIEAAARRFGLGFIPLVEEDYLLAVRRAQLRGAPCRALLEVLGGKAFRRAVAGLGGYDPARSGTRTTPAAYAPPASGAR